MERELRRLAQRAHDDEYGDEHVASVLLHRVRLRRQRRDGEGVGHEAEQDDPRQHRQLARDRDQQGLLR